MSIVTIVREILSTSCVTVPHGGMWYFDPLVSIYTDTAVVDWQALLSAYSNNFFEQLVPNESLLRHVSYEGYKTIFCYHSCHAESWLNWKSGDVPIHLQLFQLLVLRQG